MILTHYIASLHINLKILVIGYDVNILYCIVILI